MRADPDNVSPFTKVNFQTFVSRLGRLRIESVPSGAHIKINEVRQDETTDTAKWLEPGSYLISLTKDGFLPKEEQREVMEGNNPPIRMTLTKSSP
ncbi:MAG: PEGA domain-containing protein [Burkholderiales bacterium]